MAKSVSILLGAGFSAPMGYPVGNALNDKLVGCQGTEFGFSDAGTLCIDSRTSGRPEQRSSYDKEYDLCLALIKHYNETNGGFDYEEFYDYIHTITEDDTEVQKVAKPFISEEYGPDLRQLIYRLDNIYVQIVSFYLKDRNGKSWYQDAAHLGKGLPVGYNGILSCIEQWKNSGIVNVHTLNHDLFFERLSITDWLSYEVCDGFQEEGSDYYAYLGANGGRYRVRLPYYSGEYKKKVRLYKLHGSKDYAIYHGSQGALHTPEVYVKTKYGIGFSEFFKEKLGEDGKPFYESFPFSYHSDFLTGKTAKIKRYREQLLYKKLMTHFKVNLEEAEQLVIIGYGAQDTEINRMLLAHFDHENKPSFIIDPYAGDAVKQLQKDLGATLIKTELENVKIEELTNS